MEISQKLLALSALYAVIVGVGLGMVYDLFRILRIARGDVPQDGSVRAWLRLALIFAEDICYSLICAVVVIVFIFHVNQGRVRGFMLISAGVGFLLYYFTVGRLVMRMAESIIAGVRWVLRLIGRLVTRLIRRLIVCPLVWMGSAIGRRLARLDTRRRCGRLVKLAARGFK